MKTMTKKNIMKACAILAVAAVPVAFATMNTVTVNADTTTPTASEFYMTEGAAVRTTSDEVGIRFNATITKAYWQDLQTAYGADATYSFYSVVTDGTTPIKKDYGTLTPDFTSAEEYTFYSTIVYTTDELESAGLLDEACELELSAQTYVDVTKAGETEPTTIAAYGNTGKRSMKAVANAAALAGNTDEDLAKYFTEGKRSDKTEGYAFTDKSGGVVTMSEMPAWTNDMEVYYGAEKVDATYANGTISFDAFSTDVKNSYISVFDGNTVYSTKVSAALKIAQANADALLSLTGDETVYLAEDIDLAGKTWNTEVFFSGVFEGNGKAIKNLTTSDSNGFFKTLQGATVKNVAFVDVTTGHNAAAIAHKQTGDFVLENVFVNVIGSTSSTTPYIGGTVFFGEEEFEARMTNVVVYLPSAYRTNNLFGYGIKGEIYLNNVHVINDNDEYLARANDNTNKWHETTHESIKEANYTIHATATDFVNAEKNLTFTPFLTSCLTTYLPVIKVTKSNIDALKTLTGNSYVVLMDDIDLEGAEWSGQGSFAGTLDGNGHVIKNFTIPSKDSWGFFVTAIGTIKNIGFVNVTLGAASSVIAARNGSGTLTLENVFIDVDNFADTTSTYGILSKVRKNEASVVTMTNVVVSMPSSNAKIFGTLAQYETRLTNVYTIGMSTSYATTAQVPPTVTACGQYEDLAKFNAATKTLTPFLTSCVAKYFNNAQ